MICDTSYKIDAEKVATIVWFLISAKWLEQAEKGEIAPN